MDIYQTQIERVAGDNRIWDKLKGKTIGIVGVSGMIGKAVVDVIAFYNSLQRDKEDLVKVVGFSRDESTAKYRLEKFFGQEWFSYIVWDITEPASGEWGIDYILHLAGNESYDSIAVMCNTLGTMNVLKYAEEHNVEGMVYISSEEVYGERDGSLKEDCIGYVDCNTKRAVFAESKRMGEAILCRYADKVRYVILRSCQVYGPTMSETNGKVIHYFVRQACNDWDIFLQSDGSVVINYLYVTDVVYALLLCMVFGEQRKVYNVAPEKSELSVYEIAEALCKNRIGKVMRSSSKWDSVFTNAEKRDVNTQRIRGMGWREEVQLMEGLDDTIFHYVEDDIKRMRRLYDKLREGVAPIVEKYKNLNESQRSFGNDKIPVWVCWWQGEDEMPPLVKACYESIKRNMPSERTQVNLITLENYRNYVEIPASVMKRYEDGDISMTHLSDVLRSALLYEHGGFWLDSTIYMTKPLSADFFDRECVYTLRHKKPESEKVIFDGNWAVHTFFSRPYNKLFGFTRDAFAFWYESHREFVDYFMIDYLVSIAFHELPGVRENIEACEYTTWDHLGLTRRLSDEYNEEEWQKIIQEGQFYKLTRQYKFLAEKDGKLTLYGKILDTDDANTNMDMEVKK